MRLGADGERVVPRPLDRPRLVEQCHEALMHVGYERVHAVLAETYWWPGMRSDVRHHCEHCLACQLQSVVFRRRDTLGGHLVTSGPRTSWSLDCAPAIATADGTRQSILVMVDDFSKFTILAVLPVLSSKVVA